MSCTRPPPRCSNMRFTYVLAFVAITSSCQDGVTTPIENLFDAPTQVVIAQTPVTLETFIYRDFAPVSPPDGQPMIAALTVKADNRAPLPSGIQVVNMYVMHGDSVWAVLPVQEWPSTSPSELQVVARGGPKWTPGITVDVVAELRHDNASFIIQAVDQPVHRTD